VKLHNAPSVSEPLVVEAPPSEADTVVIKKFDVALVNLVPSECASNHKVAFPEVDYTNNNVPLPIHSDADDGRDIKTDSCVSSTVLDSTEASSKSPSLYSAELLTEDLISLPQRLSPRISSSSSTTRKSIHTGNRPIYIQRV
jgi:hypothetical protein